MRYLGMIAALLLIIGLTGCETHDEACRGTIRRINFELKHHRQDAANSFTKMYNESCK